jgi:hypothetical protein
VQNNGHLPASGQAPEIDAEVNYRRSTEWLIGFGPTTLWAKQPFTGAQDALWYDGSDPTGAAEWMERLNRDHDEGRYNLYLHVNLTRPGFRKRAKKPDIVSFRYIFADVDGDKDDHGRAGAWGRLGKVLVRPSLVVMSGAGFNAYWTLKEPLPNTPATMQRVEALGGRIARLTGSDGVQNVDRILRVPFTTNWPTETKIKRGRVPCPSGIVHQEHLR